MVISYAAPPYFRYVLPYAVADLAYVGRYTQKLNCFTKSGVQIICSNRILQIFIDI